MHSRAPLCSGLLAAALALSIQFLPWSVPEAQAHSYVEASIDFLAHRAQRVVVATPTDEMSTWESTDGGRRIVTYHKLQIQTDIVGEGDKQIWVRRLGGVVDKIGQRVHGVAPLRRGQPFLLFLAKRTDGTFSVVGMEQGCFPVAAKNNEVTIERRRIAHAPVPSRAGFHPASALEGVSIEEAKRIIVEAKERHAE